MAEVTIRYVHDVLGHPEAGSIVTVERTDVIDLMLSQGYAVEIESATTELTNQISRAKRSFQAVADTITAQTDGQQ